MPVITPEIGSEELRTACLCFADDKVKWVSYWEDYWSKRFSNLKELVNVSSLVLRFVRNMKCILTGK